jgi:hypothetical protein
MFRVQFFVLRLCSFVTKGLKCNDYNQALGLELNHTAFFSLLFVMVGPQQKASSEG